MWSMKRLTFKARSTNSSEVFTIFKIVLVRGGSLESRSTESHMRCALVLRLIPTGGRVALPKKESFLSIS
jgi:hypothetical protein